jgi:hypothetical protein
MTEIDTEQNLRKFTAAVMDTRVIDKRWHDKQTAFVIYFLESGASKPWKEGEIATLSSDLARLKTLQSGFGTLVSYSDLDTGYTHVTTYDLGRNCSTKDSFILRNLSLTKIECKRNKYNVDEAAIDPSVCLTAKKTLVEYDRHVLRDKGLVEFTEEENLCQRTLFRPKALI